MRFPKDKAAILVVVSIFALCLLLFPPGASVCGAGEPIGKITKFAGVVWVESKIKPPVQEWVLVKEKDYPIFHEDVIRTERGRAEIRFRKDDGVMRLMENTQLTLQESEERAKGVILRRVFLILGKVWAHLIPRRGLDSQFESNTAVAAVRGTTLEYWVDPTGEVWIHCKEGVLDVTAAGVTVQVTSGQCARVSPGSPPTPPEPCTPPPPPLVEALEVAWPEEIVPFVVVAPAPLSPATGGGGIASPSR